jgi:hypothetical protein
LCSKPAYKKQRKIIFKQTCKHLKYLNNEFINKDNKSGSDASSTSLTYSSIPSLSSPKKYSCKKKQPIRVFKGKLRQTTEDNYSGPATQSAGEPNSIKENKDSYNVP